MSAQVFNWIWLPAAPKQSRSLKVATETKQNVVIPRVPTAVILYPSLMSPCVYREDPDDPWLELLIQSKEALTADSVNRQLKLYPSLDANKRYHLDALFDGTFGKVEVEEAKPDSVGVVSTHAHFWGVIHPSVLSNLEKLGITKLYRVRVHYQALMNAEAAKEKLASLGHEDKPASAEPSKETQDALLQDVLKRRHVHEKYGKLPHDGLYGFNVVEDRGVQLWDHAKKEPCINTKEPIQAYHPVYFYSASSKAKPLNFGHLSDIHINGRLDLLRRNPAQVIPGSSKRINEIIEPTNRSLKRLLDAMRNDTEVDSLLIGGDLIDHQANARVDDAPTSMVGVWKAVGLEESNLKKNYALAVDMVSFYSLLVDFCRKSKKPVYGVSGNHDFYLEPFGISPRVATVRANEGIPADVNLTFYEAALAFGPTWGDFALKLPWKGGPMSSFEAEWAEWYYTVFTPFADFRQQLPKQELVCLGWGGDEDMFLGNKDYVAHLPLADDSVNLSQLSLLQSAEHQHPRRSVIALTHFTIASFHDDIPLFHRKKNDQGERSGSHNPSTGTLEKEENRFSMGTFQESRREVLELLGRRTITCFISGHSHRRGVYFVEDVRYPDRDRDGIPEAAQLSVVLRDPDGLDLSSCGHNLKPAIVVSDSGGPYPRHNRYGEFRGWGSDKPSGSIVIFAADGSLDRVKIVRDVEQVQPRLAVAIDYVDVLKHEIWQRGWLGTLEVQSQQEKEMLLHGADPEARVYTLDLTLSAHLKEVGLAVQTITFFGRTDAPLTLSIGRQDTYALRGQENQDFYLWLRRSEAPERFVSIVFSWIGNDSVRTRYKVDAPWELEVAVARVETAPGTLEYRFGRLARKLDGTFPKGGEFAVLFPDVPDFAWRRKRGG